ncbi:RING/U-box superfamily protein [Forsythia ovata]|uniref:RING/U-box superfamily protein n=1 Tax=Forsythia ovata TaxID=205694 RepID=A0ABD1VK09_9LAMI
MDIGELCDRIGFIVWVQEELREAPNWNNWNCGEIGERDRTITNRSSSEILQRNVRYSPSWSFRWDSRGRVAGEETSDGGGGNHSLDVKSGTTVETACAYEDGSPLDSFQSLAWQKSPITEGNAGILRLPSSDSSTVQNLTEVKESAEFPVASYPSPVKLSPSAASVSSLSTSPLSSQSHLLHPNSTPSRWHRRSPGLQLLRQVSDSRIPVYKSPTLSVSEEESSYVLPALCNESTRGSNGGSSDSWSIPGYSELMTTHRERWSFDSELSGFNHDKITRSNGRSPVSLSFDLQTCGVCAKPLTQRSSWRSQELAAVAVLVCGHVYHAECLENTTPEANKYDPFCPVCTFGEKRALKMSEKALKAEMDLKVRKRSRNRVVNSDISGDLVMFDSQKNIWQEGRGPKLSSSSSLKSSLGMPFLKRHFSFGSKGNISMPENHSTRRKGFFWAK